MTQHIYIKGLDKLEHKIDTIQKMKAVKAVLKQAGVHVKGKIADYPGRKHVSIQQVGGWKSDKQRRWFFAALRSGAIEVPYRRGQSPGSEDLANKWSVATRDSGFTVVVGNNASYGPFVQKHGAQSRMMKIIGWKTDKTVLEEERGEVMDLLGDAIHKVLSA